MFRRQTHMEKAISSVAATLIFLAAVGQSATRPGSFHPTPSSDLSDNMTTTQPDNGTMEEPRVLRMHKPCRDEHAHFCENGGQCMYPQDTDTPSCMCKPSFSGKRCMFFTERSTTVVQYEELIGVTAAVVLLIFILAVIFFCCIRKRCNKSATLIKHAPSEDSV